MNASQTTTKTNIEFEAERLFGAAVTEWARRVFRMPSTRPRSFVVEGARAFVRGLRRGWAQARAEEALRELGELLEQDRRARASRK